MQRLILFAKRPRLGRVKTRLAPPLHPEQSLMLYRAFLADQIRFLRTFAERCDLELCLDGPWTAGPDAPSSEDLTLRLQEPGDLGARLLGAFRRGREDGADATVVIGADSPTLPEALVEAAFDALEQGDEAVISPARDGGYVLLGMVRPIAELFREVPWGGPEVSRITISRATASGIDLHCLPPWYDVDDGQGLRRLRVEILQPGIARRAPETRRALARLDRAGVPVV